MNTMPYHTPATTLGEARPSPGFNYQGVDEVLDDERIDRDQKRAILSSWSSDLFAVESCPWLRAVPGIRKPLPLSEILAALRSLDDEPPPRGGAALRSGDFRRKSRPVALRAWTHV